MLVSIIVIITYSCKNKTQKENADQFDENGLVEHVEDQLVISMEIVASKDDVFEIYYRHEDESFQPENKVSLKTKGNEEVQKLNFVFDIMEFPSHLRIDFGRNPNQNSVRLESISLNYNENSHEFTREELKKFFYPNQYMKIDFESGEIELQKTGDSYNPFLNSNNIAHFFNKLYLY